MNWLSFHVASGASLMSGTGLMITGILLAAKTKGRIKFLFKLTICLGVALILLSSTPFPIWMYWLFLFLFFAWIILESTSRFASPPGNLVSRALLIGCILVMAILEIPHQRLGPLPSVKHSQLYVIGDSISAGIDENPNWGEVFRGLCVDLCFLRVKSVALPPPVAAISALIFRSFLPSSVPQTNSCRLL